MKARDMSVQQYLDWDHRRREIVYAGDTADHIRLLAKLHYRAMTADDGPTPTVACQIQRTILRTLCDGANVEPWTTY